MKMHKLRATACALRAANGRFTRWIRLSLCFWLSITAAPIAFCGFVATACAHTKFGKTRVGLEREPAPYWAFTVDLAARASHAADKPADNIPRHVPGSAKAFTPSQVNDAFNPPDWHPAGHPPMPEIVAHGRKPDVMACGFCHLPNGQGRPENASVAGLPADYIIQQMAEFKSGLRRSSKLTVPIAAMINHETKATKKEIGAAARYFSALKPRPWIRVVETRTVPRMRVLNWMLVASAGAGREPIGRRIIETPVNQELTEMRDDTSGFIAYVPLGSIKKGRALVMTGGAGETMQCATCHGVDLKGSGNVPTISGRSPSYIVRQLCDFQSGARTGPDAQLMKPVTAKLTVDEMVSIAAYLASLHP